MDASRQGFFEYLQADTYDTAQVRHATTITSMQRVACLDCMHA